MFLKHPNIYLLRWFVLLFFDKGMFWESKFLTSGGMIGFLLGGVIVLKNIPITSTHTSLEDVWTPITYLKHRSPQFWYDWSILDVDRALFDLVLHLLMSNVKVFIIPNPNVFQSFPSPL